MAIKFAHFIAKTACLFDLIQCMHDEMRQFTSKICTEGKDLGIFYPLQRHFNGSLGFQEVLMVISININCSFKAILSTTSHAVKFPKSIFPVYFANLN